MTIRRQLRTTLCGLGALLGLVSVLHHSSAMAGDKPTTLIPGYVDADGTVHPEKLLSYVDALHRAADAEVAEARIAQLQAHLSQVVATLSQTRAHLAKQTQRANAAETLAENRGKEIERLDNLYHVSQASHVALRQTDRSRLQSQVGDLITSLQQSQTQSTHLATTLDRTQITLASTTAQRDTSRQQATQLTAANDKLDTELKTTRTKLTDTTKTLDSTRSSLAVTSKKLQAAGAELAKSQQNLQVAEAAKTKALADLKELADKSKPVAVEPDSKSKGSKAPGDDAGEQAKPADKPKAAPQVEADVNES
jgi:chromosome segregation ATPase